MVSIVSLKCPSAPVFWRLPCDDELNVSDMSSCENINNLFSTVVSMQRIELYDRNGFPTRRHAFAVKALLMRHASLEEAHQRASFYPKYVLYTCRAKVSGVGRHVKQGKTCAVKGVRPSVLH